LGLGNQMAPIPIISFHRNSEEPIIQGFPVFDELLGS
jgi:hypothetical protein